VKVIVNFAPQDSAAAALHPLDMNALISILRGIAREPRIGKFSIVAFNLQERRVVYRQEDSSHIDFPALGEALHSLNLGTVDVKRLSQKRGETEFLTNLFTEELNARDHPDAVIFAGPKVLLDNGVPQESLKKVADVEYPLFYMNYNLDPQGRAVARRHRKCGEIPQGSRVHHQPAARFVECLGRYHVPYSKIEIG
jgi:hypothetical protein